LKVLDFEFSPERVNKNLRFKIKINVFSVEATNGNAQLGMLDKIMDGRIIFGARKAVRFENLGGSILRHDPNFSREAASQ
jgi:hypothetical protein